ncbi:hypothetical protein PVK06_009825 [Gossypium arboreum]|uniref:Uncharacterized protein n=1 Tax=Gossypium arboreum TaxID=29729 RepID=A0ABR0QPT5_GOSAR|nr:hypothetical protein PVK06_009825 [Gossypium arboreum]
MASLRSCWQPDGPFYLFPEVSEPTMGSDPFRLNFSNNMESNLNKWKTKSNPESDLALDYCPCRP